MYRISPSAFTALEAREETAFVAKLGRVLRDAVPALSNESEPAFSAQVRLLIEQARSFGLQNEQAIGAFAVTAGLLGVDFVDQIPAARQILEGRESEDDKARLLENLTLAIFEALDR